MEFRRLGATDLDVSVVCLGTMTWGVQNSEVDAHAQLDRAVDHWGINFIDSAEGYPVPPTAETSGRTEAYIGTWLAKRPGLRDRLVIATKVIGMNNAQPHIRDGKGRLDRANIVAAVEGSLKRLRTDRIQWIGPEAAASKEILFSESNALAALANALRLIVAADFDALAADYVIELRGDERQWIVRLQPRSATQRRQLEYLELHGEASAMKTIIVVESHGERTTTRLHR